MRVCNSDGRRMKPEKLVRNKSNITIYFQKQIETICAHTHTHTHAHTHTQSHRIMYNKYKQSNIFVQHFLKYVMQLNHELKFTVVQWWDWARSFVPSPSRSSLSLCLPSTHCISFIQSLPAFCLSISHPIQKWCFLHRSSSSQQVDTLSVNPVSGFSMISPRRGIFLFFCQLSILLFVRQCPIRNCSFIATNLCVSHGGAQVYSKMNDLKTLSLLPLTNFAFVQQRDPRRQNLLFFTCLRESRQVGAHLTRYLHHHMTLFRQPLSPQLLKNQGEGQKERLNQLTHTHL